MHQHPYPVPQQQQQPPSYMVPQDMVMQMMNQLSQTITSSLQQQHHDQPKHVARKRPAGKKGQNDLSKYFGD